MASISQIFVSTVAKLPMQSVARIKAIAHVGLEGDRYADGRGSWSRLRQDEAHRDVTLISAADIDAANRDVAQPYTAAETRRNLVVSGAIDLLSLIGQEFSIGDVRVRGVEECAPCRHPEQLTGKPGFMTAFKKRAGIRAEVLTSGEIKIGDTVHV